MLTYIKPIIKMVKRVTILSVILMITTSIDTIGQVNQGKVLDRDEYGNILELQDANGIKTAYDWSEDGTTLIGIFSNAEANNIFAHSFAYDGLDGWTIYNSDGNDTDFSVSGGKLKLTNYASASSGEADRIYYTHGTEITGTVVIEFDVKIDDSDSWDLTIAAGGSTWNTGNGGSENAIWTSINNESWRFHNGQSSNYWTTIKSGLSVGETYSFKIVAKLGTNKVDYYVDGEKYISDGNFRTVTTEIRKIAFGNYGYGSVTTNWYIDNVRMYPESAQAISQEVDPLWNTPVAIKDASGSTNRFEYDNFGRLVKSYNANGELVTSNSYYYSLDGNASFNPSDPNRVESWAHYDPNNSSNVTKSVTYLDGLGRQIQSQTRGGGETILTATTYNERGLPEVVSRPYQISGQNSYQANPFGTSFTPPGVVGAGDLIDEYDGTSGGAYPFTYTAYEESPINRPVEVQMPGGSNYTNFMGYGFLNLSESFTINGSTWGTGTLSGTAGLDPDRKLTGTYTDGWGQTIVSGVEWNNDFKLSRSSSDLVTEFAYDLRGNLVKVEDPRELETTYTYNALGQLVEKELPDQDYSEEYKYDKKGRLRFTQQPNHKAMGEVDISKSLSGEEYVNKTILVSDPGEIKIDIQVNDLTYDDYEYTVKHVETGELILDESFSPPGGSATHTLQVDPGTYKFSGQAVYLELEISTSGSYTFRSYKEFSYIKYDELDRVTEEGVYSGGVTSFAAADPDSETFPSEDNQENILYYYDGDQAYTGSLTPTPRNMKGRVSKIEYRDLSASSSSSGDTWYSYNAQGAVEWVVQDPPGLSEKSIEYEYDELGRMTQMDFQAGVSGEEFYQRYSYDGLGRLEKTESSTNGTSWETEADYTSYLADGQVETAYLYGGASNPTALSLSEMLVTSDEEYVAADSIIVSGLNVVDGDGDLTLEAGNYIRLTDGFTAEAGAAVRITANENLVGTDVGSNIAPVNYTYTVQGWLDKINNGAISSGDAFGMDLGYFYNGNISYQSWRQAGASDTDSLTYSYVYDSANRLSSAGFSGSGGAFDVLYDYDKNGNITDIDRSNQYGLYSDDVGNLELQIFSSSNKIKNVLDIENDNYFNFTYDANGNIKTNELQGITNVAYDWRNLPSQLSKGSTTLQYAYDGDGNRVKKEVAGGTEMHYLRGANGETLAIYEDGSLAFHNILSGSEVIGTYDGSQRRYFLKDHLGSVRTTVDQHGNVDSYDDYYPFGLQMPGRSSNTGNPNDDYKFTGYELDNEANLNLYHANARGYDPVLGRFMQIDPLTDQFPGWTPYHYVHNNPLNLIDPTGMAADSIVAHYYKMHVSIHRVNEETGEVTNLAEGFPSRKAGTAEKSSLGWGKLVKEQQTEVTDDGTTEKIDVPEGMTEEEFANKIQEAFKSYDESVDYGPAVTILSPGLGNQTVLPGSPNGPVRRINGTRANSNSLAGSVIRAAGSNFIPSANAPGWNINILKKPMKK